MKKYIEDASTVDSGATCGGYFGLCSALGFPERRVEMGVRIIDDDGLRGTAAFGHRLVIYYSCTDTAV
jgi:hypothetical protein